MEDLIKMKNENKLEIISVHLFVSGNMCSSLNIIKASGIVIVSIFIDLSFCAHNVDNYG